MRRVFIFGGTTEGRQLCTFLEKQKMAARIFVATEYGQAVLPETEWVQVHCGRLDSLDILHLLEQEQPLLVVDATHPYAAQVTANIQAACQQLQIDYYRLLRPEGRAAGCHYVDSMADMILYLRNTEGMIFSTLGSKELMALQMLPDYQNRLVVRVLPSVEAIAQCTRIGLSGRQIIAMQGPFSQALNEAMLQACQASILLTKDSGKHGGFYEKVSAARRCGVKIVVLRRPQQEQGYSLKELRQLLLAKKSQIMEACEP